MSTILVTGSLGTLGRPLVRELRARGHSVHGCDLRHDSDPQFTRADISEHRQLRRVMEAGPFDYVFHLAAEFGRHNGEEYFEQLWRSNVIGTRNVLELQRDLGYRVVFTSSSEVYGEAPDEWLDEGVMDRQMVVQQNDYAITKWVNEVQCLNFAARYQTPIMRVRLFNAYGPGEFYHNYRSVVCLFCYRALHGIPFDVYEGYHRVFQYVDDLIPSLANCADPERFGPGGVVNIGGREYRSVEELAHLILAETGASESLITYWAEDRHNRVNKRPNIFLAEEWLGHDPTTTLEEGIPKTIAWMREVYGV
jgi:dTDP-glucose 4,6-dehydratase